MTELPFEARLWMELQLRPDRVEGPVEHAVIDPSSACNLRCPFCPTGNGSINLDQGMVSLPRFREMLDRLGPAIRTLTAFNWGEPLLNPAFCDMVALAKSRGLKVSANTHLSMRDFGADAAERLVRSGLDRLVVSCDGASQAAYEIYRVGGDFERVMRNLRALLEAKRSTGLNAPQLIWKFLLHRGNQHEIELAASKARELGVPIRFARLFFPEAQAGAWRPDPGAAGRAGEAEAATAPSPVSFRPEQACLQAWDMPVVHSDGSVLPCCIVVDRRYSLGNLLSEPFDEIWNRPLIVAMRRYLRTGRREEPGLPCYGCPIDPHRSEAEVPASAGGGEMV